MSHLFVRHADDVKDADEFGDLDYDDVSTASAHIVRALWYPDPNKSTPNGRNAMYKVWCDSKERTTVGTVTSQGEQIHAVCQVCLGKFYAPFAAG